MSVMKKIIGVAVLFVGLNTAQAQAQIELNIGHTLNPDSHYNVFALKFKELIEKRSDGKIKVAIFGQGQLGGEVRMLQSARSGALAMVVTASAPLENTVPEYSMLSAPYLFKDLTEANRILQGDVGQHFLNYLPARGLVGLGFVSAIERNVYTSKRPIKTLADFANQKLRVIQSPAYVDTYQALGAQPTPMAYSEVYISMQNGVVDGAENSPDVMIMDRFVEVSKYFNMTKLHYMPALVVMSKARMDALTPEQQKLVKDTARDALPAAIDAYKRTYDDSMVKIKAANVEIVETDTSELVKSTRAVAEKLIKGAPDGEANFKRVEAAKAAK